MPWWLPPSSVSVGRAVRSVGILVRMTSKKRPSASLVALDGAWDAATVTKSFELTSSADDVATQMLDLTRGLRSYLSAADTDAIVIRRADQSPIASNAEGPRRRLLAGGALIAGTREENETVLAKSGRELAEASPATNKEALDNHARRSLRARSFRPSLRPWSAFVHDRVCQRARSSGDPGARS